MSEIAVTCSHVSKAFGATKAVSDIDFVLTAGEVLALVGENGAGKSTLMNMLSGTIDPDQGSIVLALPNGTLPRSVSMVHQELSLFLNLTVAENLELDRVSGGILVSERASRQLAIDTLKSLGAHIDVNATVGDLTVGQRQLVEVAKAIAVQPALLILDEPTSSLEGPQVDLLFSAVRRLTSTGTAVIFVSHRMEEMFRICDRVLVMRDGRQIEFGSMAKHSRKSLVESMVGREAGNFYPPRPVRRPDDALQTAAALEAVSVDNSLTDVSVQFPAGMITAIAGLDGHGQSEIAEVVVGARLPSSGTVRIGGRAIRLKSPRTAVRQGIGYVAPNRRLDGLMLEKSVSANTILAAAPRLFRSGFVRNGAERRIVANIVARLTVKCSSLGQSILELSGGNQQKVLIGRWLIYDQLRVLVLNDPTRGVDVGSRTQIYSVIRDLADRGVCVVLVSTDLQEILGLSDQIYVMYAGRVTGKLTTEDASEASVMHLATGGKTLV